MRLRRLLERASFSFQRLPQRCPHVRVGVDDALTPYPIVPRVSSHLAQLVTRTVRSQWLRATRSTLACPSLLRLGTQLQSKRKEERRALARTTAEQTAQVLG